VAVNFIDGGNWREPRTCLKSLTNFITSMLYRVHLAMTGVRTHTTLVVIGTDCTGSCKSNYHTFMAMTDPFFLNYRMVYMLKVYFYKELDGI
jgi:hypothetical protein